MRLLSVCSLLAISVAGQAAGQPVRPLSRADLRDKIAGGWAGQMIGVSYGAPTEFRVKAKINEGPLPEWKPERISNSLHQDDLYVDMTFAKVLDEKGLNATSADFGRMFQHAQYQLWHANLAARRNLRRGISAELSGTPKYNAHANDIDFQIEADFIGLMAPGLPQSANRIAERAGRVMNYGDGIYGGMFVSGMYAAAFFETDPRQVVIAGLKAIPAGSPYARVIGDVLEWARQYPDDWRKTWTLLEERWDRRDPCPEGALQDFNIDAKLNGAYIALGLLYGKGEFEPTLEISTRAGQDSDCNPASAAGVLGVMVGYKAIPDIWKSGIAAIAGQKFDYTDFTFNTIVDSTEKRALALIAATGGNIDADPVQIRVEEPKPPKLQVWDDFGEPAERVALSDSRWSLTGDWKTRNERERISGAKGATATFDFEGTGVILVGPYLQQGGKADIFLDGKKQRTVDVNSDEKGDRGGEAVWHAFGLKDGKHTVRLVVRGEPYGQTGADVALTGAVIFQPEGRRGAR